jgi:hypothetical protein
MNSWTVFDNLFGKKKRWTGKVHYVSPQGQVTIEIPSGRAVKEYVIVSGAGSYSVGQYVYLENNQIVGTAPELKTLVEELVQ